MATRRISLVPKNNLLGMGVFLLLLFNIKEGDLNEKEVKFITSIGYGF
jgi:hypothetical protein